MNRSTLRIQLLIAAIGLGFVLFMNASVLAVLILLVVLQGFAYAGGAFGRRIAARAADLPPQR